jgi:hypothetical protein
MFQVDQVGGSADTTIATPSPEFSEAAADGTDAGAPVGQDHILRTRLSAELEAALESPVAGLAVQTVADELSRQSAPTPDFESAAGRGQEIAGAIETLVRVALEMDDPVAALEEGTESLAEALTARDLAEQERQRAVEEQRADRQAAYHHARFHRVGELIDVGYGLEQAVAIANADEAEIRARAAAAGSDPMEAIYRYAVLNGYRGRRTAPGAMPKEDQIIVEQTSERGDPIRGLADLARLSDEAFAEATRGERWRKLMQP